MTKNNNETNPQTNKETKFYPATNDEIFKSLFCSPLNADLLKELIDESLNDDVQIISVSFPPYTFPIKGKVCEAIVTDKKGKILNLELYTFEYNSCERIACIRTVGDYALHLRPSRPDEKNVILLGYTTSLPKEYPDVAEYKLREAETNVPITDNVKLIEFNLDKINSEDKNPKFKLISMLDLDKESLEKVQGDKLMEKMKKEIIRMNNDPKYAKLIAEKDKIIDEFFKQITSENKKEKDEEKK